MRKLVFNSREWNKTGDVGDNSQFWQPAELLRQYEVDGEMLADVQFEDGTISTGHFINMMADAL